ncbi:MAG: phosphoglycerate mutase, partial [Bacteroidales bacterium]|nr:phosphoglycerate mutase [Bacteroidales bacterium]
AGHEGDVDLKIKTIEYLDKRIVKPVLDAVLQWNEPVTIALLPDHPTPCAIRTHTNKPVPFVVYRPGESPDSVQQYDEFACENGSYGLLREMEFMQQLIKTTNS